MRGPIPLKTTGTTAGRDVARTKRPSARCQTPSTSKVLQICKQPVVLLGQVRDVIDGGHIEVAREKKKK